jgi:hypothetical protein
MNFDASGGHLMGGMIALMPTEEDAKRLALRGGEAWSELHLTLAFLGDDMSTWTDVQKEELASITGALAALYFNGPLTAKIFGVAHWNGDTPSASWVWNVGDVPGNGPEGHGALAAAQGLACEAMWSTHDLPEIPDAHSPWAAHVCAAYTDDLTLAKELEKRLGTITFDRIRVSLGDEDHDYPLGDESLTAGGGPQRKLTETEVASRADFALIDNQWQSAVASMVGDYARIEEDQRADLRAQITAAIDADDPGALDSLHVDDTETSRVLYDHMITYARLAGQEMQREAERQGIQVPLWDLENDLTAAAGVDILRSVARATARSLGLSMVQSATRRAMTFVGSKRSGRDVAETVNEDLKSRSSAGPREQIGGAMSAAQNTGRMAVLSVAPQGVYVATESLDQNTCAPCRSIDGTEFTSLSAASEAYPSGGYVSCQGGGRCRGTMIAVWNRGETASAAQEAGMTAVTEALGGPPNPGTKPDKRKRANKSMADGGDSGDCPDGTDCGESDMKADDSAAASGLEGITLTEDGRILDGDGNEVESLAAVTAAPDQSCPPGMEFDPGIGDCVASKASAGNTAPWEGVLVVEGVTTGDGREFAPEALSFPEEIIPGEVLLRWNKEDSHGGEPRTLAVAVGRIDKIWRDGNKLMGKGVFDLDNPDGAEAHRRVEQKFLRGVSIDADDVAQADVELVWPESASEGENDEVDIFEMLFAQPEKMIYHGGRIRAATLCDIPAFVEAYIALTDDAGAVVAGGAKYPELVQKPMTHKRTIDGLTASLVAHGGPSWQPPAEWFTNPQLSMPTTIQITDEGRIYGHAAMWGSCHIGQTDVCVQPPHEEGHPYFMTGELITSEGTRVAVGQITVAANHAGLYQASGPAKEHYENTGNAVADVVVGNDSHGIWVAGSVRPTADPAHVHQLRAAGEVSGDWRRIGGKLRMVGLLGVNVGGFVVPNMKARVAGGAPEALIAAGRLTTAHNQPESETRRQAYKIVMDDLAAQMTEGSE